MSEVESISQEPHFAALVGIDWADQKHVWCLQAAGSEKRESGELEHTPEAVEAWVGQLCQRFGNRPIAVAVEQSRGALETTVEDVIKAADAELYARKARRIEALS